MSAAIDPHGGFRHSLSDPRDDDFQSRVEKQTFYTRVIPIALPLPPCTKSPLCQLRNFHIGECDIERLELLYQTYEETKRNYTKPKEPKMKLEAPPTKGFHKWQTVGDVVRGQFVDYQKVRGTFGDKSELKLLVGKGFPNAYDDGTIIVPCPTMLEKILDKADEDGLLVNKVITIKFTETKHVGQPQPMKCFDVDASDAKPKTQHRTTRAGDGHVPPKAPPQDDAQEIEGEVHDGAVDDADIPF